MKYVTNMQCLKFLMCLKEILLYNTEKSLNQHRKRLFVSKRLPVYDIVFQPSWTRITNLSNIVYLFRRYLKFWRSLDGML